MKRFILPLGLIAIFNLAIIFPVFSQARVQVIHNSADAAAQTVDVWLNDNLLIDNFGFRTATPFIDAPAGVDFDIRILPPNSTDTNKSLAKFTYNLADGGTYILVANGIVVPDGYNPATPFDIYVYDKGRESSSKGNQADVLVFHGSTDAPIVDVVEVGVGAGTIVDDIAYAEFDGYLELPVADYSLQIRDQSGNTTIAEYAAPIATLGLGGKAISIIASGFLNPADNNNGPAFGLWVALPEGGALVELPVVDISTARVQVIHNSADIAAQTVDIWFDNVLAIDNFQFRTATPFVDAPAGTDFVVSVAPANSSDVSQALAQFSFNLEGGKKYQLIANGLVSSNGYSPQAPFNIFVYDMAQESSMMNGNTDLLVFHGSTDAPTVDIYEMQYGETQIIDNISYGEFEGYFQVPTENYILQVRDESGRIPVATYKAPLATLGLQNYAVSVLASGFLNPSDNNGGPAFGLWVALPQGGDLVELPMVDMPQATARLQVIHNSADAAAEFVDVWLNDMLFIDNFEFRTSSPFIDAPAGVDFDVTIQPSNSNDTTNGLARFTYNLEEGKTYILVANGIVVPTGYNPPTPFDIYVYDMGREEAMMEGYTDVLVFHGSTDAPVVDVVEVEVGAGTIIDNLAYGDFAGYLELPTADYTLQIRDESGALTVAQFAAPLAELGLDGQALAIMASGFLDPSVNNDGAGFGLWVSLPTGGPLVELENTTTVGIIDFSKDVESLKVYPNPARDVINVNYSNEDNVATVVEIRSMAGSLYRSVEIDSNQVLNSRIFIGDLPAGMYLLTVTNGDSRTVSKFSKVN